MPPIKQRRYRILAFVSACLLSLALHRRWIYFTWESKQPQLIFTGDLAADSRIRALIAILSHQPELSHEGSLSSNCSDRIPLLMHQIYSTGFIPVDYRESIASCVRLNPQFTYLLWTDRDAELFLHAYYPAYVALFRGYKKPLQRSDALRYFILHYFGGVYLDMDVHCLRPLSTLVASETCFFDQERPEQSQILHGVEFAVMNSAIGCVRRHPFLDQVIRNLQVTRHVSDIISSTGPLYLTQQFQLFQRDVPLRMRRGLRVLPPEVFSPLLDKSAMLRTTCERLDHEKPPQDSTKLMKLAACRQLELSGAFDKKSDSWLSEQTLGIHRFLHLGYMSRKYSTFSFVELLDSERIGSFRFSQSDVKQLPTVCYEQLAN